MRRKAGMLTAELGVEWVPTSSLRPHPRNYQQHPDDEVEHLVESLREHGFYRPIVVGRGDVILALHGIWTAAQALGWEQVPITRKDYDPDEPRAIKLVIADNEIRHLAYRDDRRLTELLKELSTVDELLGTGFDDMMLANLAMVTRPTQEIADLNAAAQWVGMPEYGEQPGQLQIVVHFQNEQDRTEFARRLDVERRIVERKTMWWPAKDRDDVVSVRFTDEAPAD